MRGVAVGWSVGETRHGRWIMDRGVLRACWGAESVCVCVCVS